ncbi:hypothetical protein F2P81_018608 [Scophthalmus maximus]|uniref:Uncharacterized protein n=1 Tax=Scophthalmus maximus TaxID=52904 RepID=A0A6A4S560_SCOMX|nr:hypothetical protein F2P81_018608 [Scophthalmus maximus]
MQPHTLGDTRVGEVGRVRVRTIRGLAVETREAEHSSTWWFVGECIQYSVRSASVSRTAGKRNVAPNPPARLSTQVATADMIEAPNQSDSIIDAMNPIWTQRSTISGFMATVFNS